MDVTSLSIPGTAEEGGLPATRAPEAGQGADAAAFMLELLKLVSAPITNHDANSDEQDAPAEDLEGGADLPPSGNALPLDLPFALPLALPQSMITATSKVITSGEMSKSSVPPGIAMQLLASELISPTELQGAAIPQEIRATAQDPAADSPSLDLFSPAIAPAIDAQSPTPNLEQTSILHAVQDTTSAVQRAAQPRAESAPQDSMVFSIPDLSASSGTPVSSATSGLPQTAVDRAPVLELRTPFGEHGWEDGVAERVLWMVRENNHTATIRLNPPNLGPLTVSIQTQGDQATVHFQSSHTAVREALDVAVPRLREMMAESGVNLAGVNITQHGPAGQGGGTTRDPAPFIPWSSPSDSVTPNEDEPQARTAAAALGLIDVYA